MIKKMFKLIFVSIAVLLVISACSNSNDAPDDEVANDENESELDDEGESDDQSSGAAAPSGEVLSLGETGTMETAIGNFEVTPTSFRFEEEIDEDGEIENPYNGIFIIVDLTIENIDDEPIISEDLIYSVVLKDEGGAGIDPIVEFTSTNNFEGEIAPGETVTGEIIFDFITNDVYELSFGADYLESLSNEVRWILEADDAE
ncbi:DUF4352 domain-containing protein [Amphibacillus sp. Q70]|uniref:DUF4352 domain-containing protein n=1 Tax=Amphibacillus sp. Q70 TaxID=3453416 RepID=UPI003F86034E